MVPDHCNEQETINDRNSAVEKLSWLLRSLEPVKAWVYDSRGTGYGSLETTQRRRVQHRNRSCVLPATMESTTRSETGPSEKGRHACRLSDESTDGTEFDPSLETRFGIVLKF